MAPAFRRCRFLGRFSRLSRVFLPHDVEHFIVFLFVGLAFGLGYASRYLLQLVALLSFTAAIELASFGHRNATGLGLGVGIGLTYVVARRHATDG
jgi:hypothetical protein